jgi:multidrug efflux pump subunit AcrB
LNGLIAWFAQNKVAANLFMAVILVAGALSLRVTGKELIPSIALDVLIINTAFPGASPEEVERVVTERVERAVGDLPGVLNMRSFTRDQASIVSLEIDSDHDPKELRETVKSRLDGIRYWPDGVSEPQVNQVAVRRDLVTNLVLYGDADERALKALAGRVKQELLDTTPITQVEISNVRPYEMSVEVSEFALQRYGIPFSEIVTAIRRQTTDHVSGQVELTGGAGSILARGQDVTLPALEDLAIRSLPDGGSVLLQDVAWIRDGFKTSRASTTFNGQNAVYISIYRVGSQDILKIAGTVEKFVELLADELPDGVSVGIWQDVAKHYVSRIELLKQNAVSGILILFVILLMFLNMRLSFWVSLGIPVALMGAFWLLPLFGNTINMVSMFAMILVLGIVVDDAIIVGENIYSHQTRLGRKGLAGAISGAQEVAKPVVFAVLTTMIMFAPLLFLPGNEGKLMRVIPMVVIAILAFSLIESLLILPAHLTSDSKINPFDRIRWLNLTWISDLFEAIAFRVYRPLLKVCLNWRYAVIAFFILSFMVSVALITGGWIKFTYFSTIPSDSVILDVQYPRGTDYQDIVKEIDKFMMAGKAVAQELSSAQGVPVIKNVVAMYGQNSVKKADNIGAVVLEMVPSENRVISGDSIVARWREKIGSKYLATGLTFETTINKNGPELDVELLGRDGRILEAAAAALKDHISTYDGVFDLRDNNEQGKQDVQLTALPLAIELGLKMSDLAIQVGQVFHGMEVTTFTRNEEEVSVKLRYPQQEDELWHLENMLLALPDGSVVPLHMLADVQILRGPSAIRRTNGRRALRVSAHVDESVADSSIIMKSIRRNFLSRLDQEFPGVRWKSSGMQQNKKRFIDALLSGFLVALLVMYGLVATLFRSYFQPVLILFAVPFGLIGALLGHVVIGLPLTLWSLIGITAVSGVVVNDNLVLVDYINQLRLRGASMLSAVTEAGIARFRPIVLTTTTTFGGLLPMMLESSVQAQFMIPMAVSLGFGVLFATGISLVLVPASYLVLEDFRRFIGAGPTHIASRGKAPGKTSVRSAWAPASSSNVPIEQLPKRSRNSAGQESQKAPSKRGEEQIEPEYTISLDASSVAQALSVGVDTLDEAARPLPIKSGDGSSIEPEQTLALDLGGQESLQTVQRERAYRAGYEAGRRNAPLQAPQYDDALLSHYWQRGWHAGSRAAITFSATSAVGRRSALS